MRCFFCFGFVAFGFGLRPLSFLGFRLCPPLGGVVVRDLEWS